MAELWLLPCHGSSEHHKPKKKKSWGARSSRISCQSIAEDNESITIYANEVSLSLKLKVFPPQIKQIVFFWNLHAVQACISWINFLPAAPQTTVQILLFPLESLLFQKDELVQPLLLQQMEGHHKLLDGPKAGLWNANKAYIHQPTIQDRNGADYSKHYMLAQVCVKSVMWHSVKLNSGVLTAYFHLAPACSICHHQSIPWSPKQAEQGHQI